MIFSIINTEDLNVCYTVFNVVFPCFYNLPVNFLKLNLPHLIWCK